MRSFELVKRDFKVMWRDWLSPGVNVGLPITLLLVLQALEDVDEFFAPTSLAPGVVLFGFAMVTMTSAMALTQDRESSVFARLLTTPLHANDFVAGYSAPYLAVATIQAALVYFVAVLGATVPYKAVTGPWTIVLLLTIFGGAWVNLADIGGVFESVAQVFPFAHALDAIRAVMLDGAGFDDIAGDLVWVLASTVVIAIVAVVVFRRRMVQ